MMDNLESRISVPPGINVLPFIIHTRGCQRCNFVLQSALSCVNMKWQAVEPVGLKKPFCKLPRLSCKNDEAVR